MVSSDFRKDAREKLSGKWGKAALITLAYAVVSAVLSLLQSRTKGAVSTIISIIVAIIEVPLSFGLIVSFVKLFKAEDVGAFDFLKSGFENFKKAWGVTLYTFLKMIWPVVLFIVSTILLSVGTAGALIYSVTSSKNTATLQVLGFISIPLIIISIIWMILLSYYYKIAPIIAADNENMTGKEAVEESRRIMKGKRGKLFCLELSFIGWAFLGALSFGIGFLWIGPYMQTAVISFYKNISTSNTTDTVEE